ncbi:MAG: hypothetical protein JKY12_08940 [Sneathiella sp.]|nr:hypothetical protein [Sneathiella sp.]
MRHLTGIIFFVVSLIVGNSAAFAGVGIKAFEGRWEGNAVSESSTSLNFAVTSRDMDVEFRPQKDNAFILTWRTLLRQNGTPNAPDAVLKETTRTYLPVKGTNTWHSAQKGDVYNGDTISWATLKGQEIIVYSMALNAKGGYDMLIYKRTLTGLGMKLEFKAMRNGNLRRTASGTLIRSGK